MEAHRLSPIYVGPTGFKPCTFYFVGEAPGKQEDREKRPFCGESGSLLRRALGEAGFDWGTVRMWNVCHYRPYWITVGTERTRNRKPTPGEIGPCIPHVIGDIKESRPKIVICLGETAYRWMCHPIPVSYSQARGKTIVGNVLPCPLTVQYHPSYVLRQNEHEDGPVFREYVEAFRKVRTAYT